MTRKRFLLAAFLTPLLIAASVRADNMGGEAEDPVCCERPTSNWYVGLDVPVLKPHTGTLGFGYGAAHPEVDITPSHDFEISPRIFLGWENADGLGLRARYRTFDADATEQFAFPANHPLAGVLAGTKTWLKADTIDIEATQRGCLGQMQFQVAGGVRYAKMETGVGAFGTAGAIPFDVGIGMEFEGVGPTVAIDLRRPFGSRGFALVGGVRASWLYGQTDAGLTG